MLVSQHNIKVVPKIQWVQPFHLQKKVILYITVKKKITLFIYDAEISNSI